MLNTEPTLDTVEKCLVILDKEYDRIEQYVENLTFENSASIDELEAIEKTQGQLLAVIADLRLVKTDVRVFTMNSKNFKW